VKLGQGNFSDLIHTYMHFHGHASDPCRFPAKIML
jgi:hypothetical protein